MARTGNLFVAGADDLDGAYKCGVSHTLTQKAPISEIYNTKDGDWQVEFSANSNNVAARTMHEISYHNTQSGGFSAIQEALDVLSVKGIYSASLAEPGNSNVCVYSDGGKAVLSVYRLLDFPIGIHVNAKQVDASGKEANPSRPSEPIWNESFRYYRLSQCSNDLFDAYRNLFLAFESILNSTCRKKYNEHETKWLERALAAVHVKSSLSHFTPTGKEDPVSYIINSQYKDVRCRLQHAKFPEAQLPHADPTPQDVKQAYSELVKIWRFIAEIYFSAPAGRGIFTHVGFLEIMENTFHRNLSIHYSTCKYPPQEDDTKVSPGGSPSWEFGVSKYAGQVKPGVVRIIGREGLADNSEHYKEAIYRVCVATSASLFGVAYIESGLSVSGVDEWECITDFRLINSHQPRVEFKT